MGKQIKIGSRSKKRIKKLIKLGYYGSRQQALEAAIGALYQEHIALEFQKNEAERSLDAENSHLSQLQVLVSDDSLDGEESFGWDHFPPEAPHTTAQAEAALAALKVAELPYEIRLDATSGDFVALSPALPLFSCQHISAEEALQQLLKVASREFLVGNHKALQQTSWNEEQAEEMLGRLLRIRHEVLLGESGEKRFVKRFETKEEAADDLRALAALRSLVDCGKCEVNVDDRRDSSSKFWAQLMSLPELPIALLAQAQSLLAGGVVKALILQQQLDPESGVVTTVMKAHADTPEMTLRVTEELREKEEAAPEPALRVESADFLVIADFRLHT